MELRTHEEMMELRKHEEMMELWTNEDIEKKRKCDLRFHFFFELIKEEPEADKKKWEEFDWAINANPRQRLYLSKDTKRLMVVVNNFVAIVYRRYNID